MSDRIHRVVVSLTDAMHKVPISIRESLLDCEINILDKTTMLMRLKSGIDGFRSPRYYQQMQFDAVGYEDDRHVRSELNEMLVQMFRHHRHACLLRLTPRRAHNVKLMTRLLVSDVDKVLQKLPYHLEGINVEFHDLRKFDMINMLAIAQRINRRRDQQSRRNMQTTRDMFEWLHTEYNALRGRGTGDEFINVEFVLGDGFQKQHRINLAIFNIFDCNERSDIGNFFKELPTGRQRSSTLLTDCIKESFDSKRAIFTLVLCEMPLDKECAREMHKFLQLADMACMNIGISNKSDLQVKPLDSTLSLECQSKSSSTRSSESKYLRCCPLSLSAEDHSKLASWYQRIDNKFAEVKTCMERHYNVQYRQKFQKISKELKNLRSLQDKSGGDAGRLMLKNGIKDEAITAKYMEVLKQFRQLEKEVKKSPFVSTLSTYMITKNYALVNAEKILQEREVTNLHEHRSRMKIAFW
ncbi:hypothetical protein ACLKA7_009181 [Drosophila subpalustris]